MCNPYIYNRTIYRTLAYLEPHASSKACGTHTMIRYIQRPCIVKTVFKHFQRYFRVIDAYSATLTLPWKFSGCMTTFRYYSFCRMLHIKYLAVPWTRLCLDNCSVICTVTLSYILHQTHSELWNQHHYGYNKPLTTVCWKMPIFQLKLPMTK